MRSLYCNMCKKVIDNPVHEKNFYYFREYTLCADCVDEVDERLHAQVLKRSSYSAEWYKQQFLSYLEQHCTFERTK